MIGSERPPEALAQYTGFLMNWVARRSRERFAKALEAELGLHPREFGVLAVVQREPGITQQAIGDAAGVDPSTMVATLDGLEERGLAERRPHSSDRRKRAVYLTDDGQEAAAAGQRIGKEVGKEVFGALTRRRAQAAQRPAPEGRRDWTSNERSPHETADEDRHRAGGVARRGGPRARRGPGEALVRPLAVALCDLDHLMIQGQAPIPGEIALGHEQVGEVVAVGDEVADHGVGDLVAVPFQISCGACDFCRRGRTGDCEAVPPQSMYGFGMVGGDWGGALADLVRVPFADAMLVPVPKGVDPVSVASAGDNVVDGWRTVAGPLARRPGAPVLVVGGLARSVGLYAVDAALALGSASVTYLDADPGRLAVAADLGAEVVEGPPSGATGAVPGDGGRERLA